MSLRSKLVVVFSSCLALLASFAAPAIVPVASAASGDCRLARIACRDAATLSARACSRDCGRLGDRPGIDACRAVCRATRNTERAACLAVAEPCTVACPADAAGCGQAVRTCRAAERAAGIDCRAKCAKGDLYCSIRCDRERAARTATCGFTTASIEAGSPTLPDLPAGEPADLGALLDPAEMAVVEAADARAVDLRSRPLRIWTGSSGAEVTVTQIRHAFSLGFPIDLREFDDPSEDLTFYTDIAQRHTNLVVMETGMKWRNAQPTPDGFAFGLADREIAWAEANGFPVKGHTLFWGNVPPLSSGSGVPEWIRQRFPNPTLNAAQRQELTALLRRYVETTVARYRGRIDIWDVTNETLNIFTPFFMARLGLEILPEIYRWVHAIDPGCELVFNEWITEVFTGLPGPDAAAVRDRVQALLAAGVPIHAIGQQGHFVPGIVYAGGTADLSQRSRIDDYLVALDTLAEAGLPVHITETNFVAPEEPEARAAQAEALMRLWWGHPAVDQIVFWGLWNKVAARNHLQIGLWDDAGALSRHGAAVVSLLNDRWRTRATLTADADGSVALRATFGDYVASWTENGQPVHMRFRVDRAPGTAVVAARR